MIRQSMTATAMPLCETIIEAPEPRGTEVLVRISRCGVATAWSVPSRTARRVVDRFERWRGAVGCRPECGWNCAARSPVT